MQTINTIINRCQQTSMVLEQYSKQQTERWRKQLPKMECLTASEGIDRWLWPELMAKVSTGETNDRKGILLGGVTGCGKTRRFQLLSSTLNIKIIDAYELVYLLSQNNSSSYFRDLCNLPMYSDVPPHYYDLIIDDLGSEMAQQTVYGTKKDIMEQVLIERYKIFPRWKTHFATNLNEGLLKKRYGERIWSRINEMCNFVVLPGDDRRMM